MTFVSMFAGVGGLDLGLERAGHTCVGQVEIDAYCNRVLEKHWPDVWRHDDITTLDPKDIPEADLWTAGFPCTDISDAGKRAGLSGEHSGLFWELVRAVRVVRPKYLLLENVAALLHRGMGQVLGELAESGYDTEWDCIPAAAVGALHLRTRVFIAARSAPMDDTYVFTTRYVNRQAQPPSRWRWLPNPAIGRGMGGSMGNAGIECVEGQRAGGEQGVAARHTEQQLEGAGDGDKGAWATEPDVGRVAHGVPARVDRIRTLGNAVVPAVGEYLGRLLMEA